MPTLLHRKLNALVSAQELKHKSVEPGVLSISLSYRLRKEENWVDVTTSFEPVPVGGGMRPAIRALITFSPDAASPISTNYSRPFELREQFSWRGNLAYMDPLSPQNKWKLDLCTEKLGIDEIERFLKDKKEVYSVANESTERQYADDTWQIRLIPDKANRSGPQTDVDFVPVGIIKGKDGDPEIAALPKSSSASNAGPARG